MNYIIDISIIFVTSIEIIKIKIDCYEKRNVDFSLRFITDN